MTTAPIQGTVERWHEVLANRMEGLEDLIHEDCVFLSPIVFTPQEGRDLTMLYLRAAGNTLNVPSDSVAGHESSGTGTSERPFRYVKEILDGHQAALEFETVVDGISMNGIDIITCDDDGQIIEFKVMVRPLKAVNKIHEQMRAMLEQMQNG